MKPIRRVKFFVLHRLFALASFIIIMLVLWVLNELSTPFLLRMILIIELIRWIAYYSSAITAGIYEEIAFMEYKEKAADMYKGDK